MMRVYYFTNEEFGLQNIERSRLKISDFNNLNDPFELLGIEMSDKSVRKSLNFEKSEIAQNTGLICFSEEWQDPVQWGHYADNHKGLCLGFDVVNTNLEKVSYVKSRLSAKTISSKDRRHKLLTTKFKHWSYEQEHRAIIDLTNRKQVEGLYFENFSEELVLKEIIIGCESKLTQGDVRTKILEQKGGTRIFNARPAFRNFKIVWDRSKKSTNA